MEKFEQLWAQLVAKRPKLGEPDSMVEITSDNLRALLMQFYEKGQANRKFSEKIEQDFRTLFSDGRFGR